MKAHFFKAFCRIGIVNKAYKSKDENIGVEEAPNFILSEDFLKTLKDYQIDHYRYGKVTDKKSYQKILAREMTNFSNLIKSKIKPNEIQIVIGGDHSVAFSAICALLLKNKPEDIGYIQFDSHGDCNSFQSSPTGNFHGMFLRPFLDDFDSKDIVKIIPEKLKDQNVLFVGDLDLQTSEVELFEDLGIQNITSDQFRENPPKALMDFREFIQKFKHIHISFDVDVFKKSIVSATGTPAHKGLTKHEVFALLNIATQARNLSFDIVEVNPKKGNPNQTVVIAQQVIGALLSKNH